MHYVVNQNQRKHILAAHRIIHNVVEKEDILKRSSDSEKTADTAKEILFEDDEPKTQHLQEKSEGTICICKSFVHSVYNLLHTL